MIFTEEEYLAHYGTPRKSGRYPWGSGGNSGEGSQRNPTLLDDIADLKAQGLTEVEIRTALGMNSTEFRRQKSLAKNELKRQNIMFAQKLRDKGVGYTEIGRRMDLNESTVRALLAGGVAERAEIIDTTADMLKDAVGDNRYIDIGTGSEHHIAGGISKDKLATAVQKLKNEGYTVEKVQVDQLGGKGKTTIRVLAPPGTTYPEIKANMERIEMLGMHTEDGGRSWLGVKPPTEVDPKRVDVVYGPDGGALADGVIYVRPGVADISLGGANYAQVRIAVGDKHYLKGMAMYKDDLPQGVDLQFNTNKERTGNKLDALKKMNVNKETGDVDMDNPFGAVIRQIDVTDGSGKKVQSAMNIVNEEGKWDDWSKNLSSQMLSKQSPKLIKQQLDETYRRREEEYEEILSLTNPAVRKKLLESFADGSDAASVHLKAAALPRQATKVILPINSMKPTEVYAPTFNDGEIVALVRYPHGGVFEIPELTVNNRNRAAKKALGNATDAIGINAKVAERLSGADFDGDTVLVIPNNNRAIKTAPALKQLNGFDPQRLYKLPADAPQMSPKTKQRQMGDVSNLITDMTIAGAPFDEISRAVRHSMVVIDAEKHHLDYKQSARDMAIPALKAKYQGKSNAGAATLISRATSEQRVGERKLRSAKDGGPIDPLTGKKVYTYSNAGYETTKVNKRTGATTTKWNPRTESSTKLAETDDARTLISKGGTVQEELYAAHSNRLKGLANSARKEYVATPSTKYSPSAKKAYAPQVKELDAALRLAQRNAPLERQAQVIANTLYKQRLRAQPDMEAAEKKKIKFQALEESRRRTGAGKEKIVLTPTQWAAIQAGAISNHKLEEILTHADLDKVKELATPKVKPLMTSVKVQRARSMAAAGATQAEIASALGVSLTTLKTGLNGGG